MCVCVCYLRETSSKKKKNKKKNSTQKTLPIKKCLSLLLVSWSLYLASEGASGPIALPRIFFFLLKVETVGSLLESSAVSISVGTK